MNPTHPFEVPVLLHNWEGKTVEDVIEDFMPDDLGYRRGSKVPSFEDMDILFGAYSYGDYDGEAFVLFRRDGKLWEVNGSHCSCMGLEGQWNPEETTVQALRLRLAAGTFGRYDEENTFAVELSTFLDSLEASPGVSL